MLITLTHIAGSRQLWFRNDLGSLEFLLVNNKREKWGSGTDKWGTVTGERLPKQEIEKMVKDFLSKYDKPLTKPELRFLVDFFDTTQFGEELIPDYFLAL